MKRNISKTVYKVADFLSWQRSGSLVLSPSFQRRPVWPTKAKSLLIDTVVNGIPMPIVFLRERTDLKTLEPIREVVDGQQRLRTIISFIAPNLLHDLNPERDYFVVKSQHNKKLADKSFAQFMPDEQEQILNYDFSVHVLPSDTDDREVLQIFARMNSTGIKLNPQEIRNAEYYGAYKRLSYDLAYEQLSRWRDWEIFSEDSIARMDEVQATSDFLRLMLQGLQGMSQPKLDALYKIYEEGLPEEDELSRRFRLVMDRIDETLGSFLSATTFQRKSLFDTLFAFFYDLMFGIGSALVKVKPNPVAAKVETAVKYASAVILNENLPEKLAKVLRGGTNNRDSRQVRLKFLRELYENA